MKPNSQFHRLLSGKRLSRTASILSLALLATSATNAATIYSEDFNTGTTTSFSTIGWSALRFDGTNDSGTTSPTAVVSTAALIASSGSIFSTHTALISDAGSIDRTAYQNDLTISFDENATDAGTASPEMGWRVLAQVGSTIYTSNFFQHSGSFTTRNVTVSDSVWSVWTGETDLSNGFNIANISGTAGNLAAGTISNIGILAIDGDGSNDRLRLDNFIISGTAIPEPSSALLGGLGLLALFRRRR